MTTHSTVLLPPVRPVARPVERPPWWRRVRRQRDPARRRRPLRTLVRCTAVLLVLVIATAGWLGARAAMAVSTLAAAEPALRDITRTFEGGDRDTVLRSVDEVQAAVGHAHDLIDEPVWRAAEHLPWLGSRLHAVRAAAGAADILATEALGPAVALSDTVWFGPYEEGEGFTELLQATELRGDVMVIADALVRARESVEGITTDLVVPEASQAFAQGLGVLDEVADIASGLGPALDLMLDITGYPEASETAIVVLDDTVHRPLGGEIDRVYLVSAERGEARRLEVVDLPSVRAAAAASRAFAAAAAGPQGTLLTTPEVTRLAVTADAGAALAEAIAEVAGVAPRAVVVVTPEGLDTMHAPTDGTAEPLADILAAAPEEERHAMLDEAMTGIVGDVLGLRASADAMAVAIGQAVTSGTLRVWSADDELQEELSVTRGGGGLPVGSTIPAVVTADDTAAPSRLVPARLTTATGQCGLLWTRRAEAVITVEVEDVPDAGPDAVASRLHVAVPRDAVLLGVQGPEGAIPYEVLDLDDRQLLTVTPSAAGAVSVRLAGAQAAQVAVDVIARGGVPAPEDGDFGCAGRAED